MAELKPCQFCGGKAEVRISLGRDIVSSTNCHAEMAGSYINIDSLIEEWNTRESPAVNRWIPCSERLPEDFDWCLVCMSDGCIRLGKWNGEFDEQGVWWVSHPNSGGKLYCIKNVPFWMPLPEPPESEVQE